MDMILTVMQDVRYALRGFRRSPLFVIAVVGTIALGLGIDTALFTVFNAYYFRPVDVRDPHSLYSVVWMDRTGGAHDYSWPEFQEFLKENPSFSEAMAYQTTEVRMNDRHAFGLLVSGNYFQVLGINTVLGRPVLPEDASAPGREAVAVLSHTAWQTRFAEDPNIIGKTVIIRGYVFKVIGVAKPGFRGLGARPTDFWAPLTVSALFQQGPDLFGPEVPRSLSIVGRLRSGASLSQCRAGATVWMQRATVNGPAAESASNTLLTGVATYKPWRSSNLITFSPIMVAFSLVLLIGCANVANMMLARSMARQREFGIRLSLGATQKRLIRQLLLESILLAIPAAVGGFLVSQISISLTTQVLFATLPPGIADFATRLPVLAPDLRVLAYNLAAAMAAAVLFGLAPARQSARTDVSQATRGEFTTSFRAGRLRDGLVLGQVTVCVLLLITTGVLLRGVNEIKDLDHALSKRDSIEIHANEKFRGRILDRLLAEPQIEVLAAGAASPAGRKKILTVKGDQGSALQIASNSVSPEYFQLFELPILSGRDFTAEEARSGASVAIVSESTAKLLWPKQAAIGRSLTVVPDAKTHQRGMQVSIIGVTRDDITRWITNGEDKTLVYFPSNTQTAGNVLFAGVRGDAEAARRALDANLAAIDPGAVEEMRKFQIREFVVEDAYSFRLAYWVSSAIGILALLLTLSGIYGVVAFVVSQRTREIGIRMALGATTSAVSMLVLKQSMKLALIGALVGGLLAAGISKILAASLVMINTFDGLAYLAGTLLVLAAAASAAYFPSRRAAGIQPVQTLRHD